MYKYSVLIALIIIFASCTTSIAKRLEENPAPTCKINNARYSSIKTTLPFDLSAIKPAEFDIEIKFKKHLKTQKQLLELLNNAIRPEKQL